MGPPATSGQAFGDGLFIQGDQQVSFAPASGQTLTIAGAIADQTGSGGTGANAGAGGVLVDGGGTVVLDAANSYTGGTTINAGTLEVASGGTAGSGTIGFGGAAATLRLDAPVVGVNTFANALSGIAGGDQIDLAGLAFSAAAGAPSLLGGILTVFGNGGSEELEVTAVTASSFVTSSDGVGGTMVTATGDTAPTITQVAPAVVEHSQTTEIATVTPGAPGDVLQIQQTGGSGAVSLLSVGGAEEVIYTAPASVVSSGTDAVSYTVSDQSGLSANGTATVQLDSGPSVATGGALIIGHGQMQDVTALLDSLVTPGLSGDAETITVATAQLGQAVLAAGDVAYTAPAAGSDAIAFSITDQLGGSASGTVAVTVDPGPVALDGSLTIGHNQATDVTALIDGLISTGLAGDTETVTSVTGNAVLTGGTVTYTSPSTGPDSFTYTATDQLGDAASGTVAVTVDPGPAAGALSSTLNLDASADLTAAILGADTAGLPGDTLSLSAVDTSGTAGSVSLVDGELTYVANGSILNRIPANGSFTDHFRYTVTDELGDTAENTVTVTVINPATIINGPSKGHATIQGTPGADVITAFGAGNTIFSNGGNDVIKAGTSQATVYVGTGSDTVTLAGTGNLVQGFPTGTPAAGGDVTVTGKANTGSVFLGDGQDVVTITGNQDVAVLGNGNDQVTWSGSRNLAELGNGGDQIMMAGNQNVANLGDGADLVTMTGNQNLAELGNGSDQVTMTGNLNVAELGDGNNQVTLSGSRIQITAADGDNMVSAIGGAATVTLGHGTNTVTVTDSHNTLMLGSGTDIVNAATHDTITLNATNLELNGGTGATVFIGSGPASIDDLSSAMLAKVGPGSGNVAIADLFKDAKSLIDLIGGVGGYHSASAAVAALTMDGSGGTMLSLGGSGQIDFVGTSKSFLTAAHFRIG